jgi:ligand-binding sensor domain-containing protein/serine phosphatase RsbU (regulator of sigma subunit)
MMPYQRSIRYFLNGWLVLTFLLCLQSVYGQSFEYKFDHLTIEDGLSQNTVLAILQDKRGFLWVGTADGLNRYDGIHFKIYKNDLADEHSLAANYVQELFEDRDGQIWIGTGTKLGLHRYDHRTDRIIRYPNPYIKSEIDSRLKAISEDRQGRLWLGYEGAGVFIFNKKTEQFTKVNQINAKLVHDIAIDDQNHAFIGTEFEGLFLYDIDKQQLLQFLPKQGEPSSISSSSVTNIIIEKSGNAWMSTTGGLNYFDQKQQRFTRYQRDTTNKKSLITNYLSCILLTQEGQVWTGSYEGYGVALMTDREKKYFQTYTQSAASGSINNNDINCLYQDRSGVIWIGTYNGGLNKISRFRSRFKHYKNEVGNDNSLSSNSLRSIFEDRDGNIWVATVATGVDKIDLRQQTITHFRANHPQPEQRIASDRPNRVYQDRQGQFWIGHFDQGLDLLGGKSVQNYQSKNTDTLFSNYIRVIHEDRQGRFWIGAGDGLVLFDKEQKRVLRRFKASDHPDSLSNDYIKSISEDAQGNLWLATNRGGICFLDVKTNRFKRFLHDPQNPNSLTTNSTHCLHIDRQGIIWVGTVGAGLNRFDPKNNRFSYFGEKEGLSNSVIYGILEDEHGYLWISTNNGLSRFDTRTFAVKNFTPEDGLQSREFNTHSYYKGASGRMYFGGINGLNVFHPDSIKESRYIPEIVITDFELFDKPVQPLAEDGILSQSITDTRQITLSYEQNVFSFEFVSLDFNSPQKNQYAYRLVNFNPNWTYTNYQRNIATYTNLAPGEYVFEVKASNSDGVWSNQITQVHVVVRPPWWETWWARTLAAVLVSGAALAFYRWRVRDIKQQNQRLELQVVERTTEIQIAHRQLTEAYQDMKILGEIGQQITAILDIETLIDKVYKQVNELMDATAFGIGVYNRETNRLEFIGFMEEGRRLPDFSYSLDEERMAIVSFKSGQPILINNYDTEYHQYLKEKRAVLQGKNTYSMIFLPLILENQSIGVITVQSFQKNAYSLQDQTILQTLASYVAIAIDNARSYQALENARRLIDIKSQSIMDSLRYAQTIQHSILPTEKEMREAFEQYFVLFEPKDVVSGDFYWMSRTEDQVLVAVLDCTGHGVPGAFMSLIGYALLNEIVNRPGVHSPSGILEDLNTEIKKLLHDSEYHNTEYGMDACFCRINTKTHELTYAGAKRPLLYIENNEVQEIKGSNVSISSRKAMLNIEEKSLTYAPGTWIYLTSDGYISQNNAQRETYGTLRLKTFLQAVSSQDAAEQCQALTDELNRFREQQPFRDDISILGICLP